MNVVKKALQYKTGPELAALRHKLSLNQSLFWNHIGVTQSGGSRYESGRNVPFPVLLLANIAYGSERTRTRVLRYLHECR